MQESDYIARFEDAIFILKQTINRAKELSISSSPYSRTQLELLFLLERTGNKTTSDIARSLGLTSGSVTQTVETLVQRGLVKRDHDTSDRRVIRLSLSDMGLTQAHKLSIERKQKLEVFFKELSPSEIKLLVSSAERLTQLIEKHITNTKG